MFVSKNVSYLLVLAGAAAAVCLILLFSGVPAFKGSDLLAMATTTSVENSGLLDALIPAFEQKYGITVRHVAAGTGEALRIARDGNADIILVHDRNREERFVQEGFGTRRHEFMKNYFVLLGPDQCAAELKGKPVRDILRTAADRKLPFVSRGDESGTHAREKSLWAEAGITEFGPWYLEAGSGMAATLRVANEKRALLLSDTATYLAHRGELKLVPYCAGEESLLNVYSLIPVNPVRFPQARLDLAKKFIRYVSEEEGRDIIREYGRREFGEPLFALLSEEE